MGVPVCAAAMIGAALPRPRAHAARIPEHVGDVMQALFAVQDALAAYSGVLSTFAHCVMMDM